ncbi:MAG: hypothetical protein AXW17_13270 [Colwellia sp. Phe_37]|nr:MAG: hypothetical protein AXW17_13270 [Colwellia sp. Phe_37]
MKKNNSSLVMCLADPSGNPRPKRMVELLQSVGFTVDVLSYSLKENIPINRHFKVSIWPKTFLKRLIRFSIRLFLWLIPVNSIKNWGNNQYYGVSTINKELDKCRYGLIIVEDLQLLPLAFEIKNSAKIIFDAREYYPKQNEESLLFRLFEKSERTRLCSKYLNYCDTVVTVSPSLANEYRREFNVKAELVRSTPSYYECSTHLPSAKKVRMVHHGAANRNRHLEKLIEVFSKLDERFTLDFYLVGDANYIDELKLLAAPFKKINFKIPVIFNDIIPMLNRYDIGFFYVEPTTFNLRYCLPNKFFEFIQARLMVAIGPSPDMAELVEQYDCGIISPAFKIEKMAEKLNGLTAAQILKFKNNSNLAAKTLCFEEESKKLQKIIATLMA